MKYLIGTCVVVLAAYVGTLLAFKTATDLAYRLYVDRSASSITVSNGTPVMPTYHLQSALNVQPNQGE